MVGECGHNVLILLIKRGNIFQYLDSCSDYAVLRVLNSQLQRTCDDFEEYWGKCSQLLLENKIGFAFYKESMQKVKFSSKSIFLKLTSLTPVPIAEFEIGCKPCGSRDFLHLCINCSQREQPTKIIKCRVKTFVTLPNKNWGIVLCEPASVSWAYGPTSSTIYYEVNPRTKEVAAIYRSDYSCEFNEGNMPALTSNNWTEIFGTNEYVTFWYESGRYGCPLFINLK